MDKELAQMNTGQRHTSTGFSTRTNERMKHRCLNTSYPDTNDFTTIYNNMMNIWKRICENIFLVRLTKTQLFVMRYLNEIEAFGYFIKLFITCIVAFYFCIVWAFCSRFDPESLKRLVSVVLWYLPHRYFSYSATSVFCRDATKTWRRRQRS